MRAVLQYTPSLSDRYKIQTLLPEQCLWNSESCTQLDCNLYFNPIHSFLSWVSKACSQKCSFLTVICIILALPPTNHHCTCSPDAAAAKSLPSCPTLCDPIHRSPPGSPVPGILQARTLDWVAISFSNAWKWKVKVKSLSYVWLFETPWTAAHQAPPSMGFSRQEYWSGWVFHNLWMFCIVSDFSLW